MLVDRSLDGRVDHIGIHIPGHRDSPSFVELNLRLAVECGDDVRRRLEAHVDGQVVASNPMPPSWRRLLRPITSLG